jgi:glycosyltransferase involved in cell wall biosynthesis
VNEALDRAASVLAIVPHYDCEAWLADCLDSLVRQSRPLQGIVVVDDASPRPPLAVVERFPQATLLAAAENVGPYRLTQTVIDQTGFDAYLFQDADDWSATHRLGWLLVDAERTGAALIGCQGYRVLGDEGEAVPLTYPADVNAALAAWPARYALLHPTSLVSRRLVRSAGGFATGLRFSGDLEFQHRAVHVGRLINSRRFAYFKRVHANALTARPDTGIGSPARQALWEIEG